MAKILLIEDDSLIIKIYSTRLKADGFDVISADNGEDGIAIAQKEMPDFILLDVMMPKMDGFKVLETLRAKDELKSIPIVVYSNLAQESEIQKAIDLGATEFIVKANISPTELVNKIKSYVKA
jgi:DNA-binding response OmpR family regulator